MRTLDTITITDHIEKLCKEINYKLDEKVLSLIEESARRESSIIGREVFSQMFTSYKIAKEDKTPLCQDTGIVSVFLDIGQEILLKGIPIEEAVNIGVRRAYTSSFFRSSIVKDPIGKRENTMDNTPCVIHTKFTTGEKIKISILVKGFGSENATTLKMFPPTATKSDIEEFLLEVIKEKGPNACPPLFIGIGIGGTADYALKLSKEALLELQPMDEWESYLLNRVNNLCIGPAGLGGDITAIYVKTKTFPTHIAGLPVAININCHILRIGSVII
ncbi:MAG: fumarate hydratase [bacterium]|nr:fumarate hydratase [bacterium]